MEGFREGSRVNPVSDYIALIATMAVTSLALLLFFSMSGSIYKIVDIETVQKADVLVNIGGIIMLFLLFNTTYYALISYHRGRMLVLSSAFLCAGAVQLMGITNYIPLFSEMGWGTEQELIYGTLSRLIIGIGALSGIAISPESQLGGSFRRLIKTIPFAVAGIVLWAVYLLVLRMPFITLPMDIKIMYLGAEYLVAGLYFWVVVAYVRAYRIMQNRFMIHGSAGFLILTFSQMLKIGYGLPPELTEIAFSGAQAVGLFIYYVALFRNNIDIPLTEMVNAEKQIKLYAENLEKIVERRTAEIRQVNARFIREMDYARSIQQSLLPLKRLNFKGVVFYSEYYPCERLSGDFFDIYRIDEDNVGMYVLDVSGHGISAALMTMFCNNYIKSTERLIKRYRGLKPHRNLKHFYEEFNKMNFPEEMHMVIFFASYNTATRVLTYSSGGINCNPILVRRDGSWQYLDKSRGFPICRLSDFFEPEYTSEVIQLEDGDRIIFYTDGLIDRDKNSLIDQDELIRLMTDYKDKPLKALNRSITDRVDSVSSALADDVTYFIMEVSS